MGSCCLHRLLRSHGLAQGFLLQSPVLTIVGSLIGFSGAILTKIMHPGRCRDMTGPGDGQGGISASAVSVVRGACMRLEELCSRYASILLGPAASNFLLATQNGPGPIQQQKLGGKNTYYHLKALKGRGGEPAP